MEWRDIEAAQCLVSLAIKCGFRESGITSADGKRVIEWGFYKNGATRDDDQLERTANGDGNVLIDNFH
ncbi:hypothetical protein NC651_026159 [Populus alba x Populus x berolinensis]|nr:hypothetical protein NC651_026159 [Populus alba x Populus x berolinensis]